MSSNDLRRIALFAAVFWFALAVLVVLGLYAFEVGPFAPQLPSLGRTMQA